MEFLTHLWLPILVSAAAVWVASALAWMLIGHHKNDMKKLDPGARQALMDLIKSRAVAPGVYGFPDFGDCKGMTEEQKKEMMNNPMGILRVWGRMGMAGPMIFGFVWSLIIGVLLAYMGHAAMGHEKQAFAKVFQVMGTAGVLAYAFGGVVSNVWFQESRRAMVMCFIDGVVYGLITGAIFAWLWGR
jgi:hypothetical protein